MLWKGLFSVLSSGAQAFAIATSATDKGLPIVDLGYTRYKASYNVRLLVSLGRPRFVLWFMETNSSVIQETGDFYAFKNIRFADPPVGQLRFKRPRPVSTVDQTVNDGSVGFSCPQAFPEGYLKSGAIAANITTEQLRDQILEDPTMSEDCLFLNVIVPKDIYRHTPNTGQDKKKCSPKKGGELDPIEIDSID